MKSMKRYMVYRLWRSVPIGTGFEPINFICESDGILGNDNRPHPDLVYTVAQTTDARHPIVLDWEPDTIEHDDLSLYSDCVKAVKRARPDARVAVYGWMPECDPWAENWRLWKRLSDYSLNIKRRSSILAKCVDFLAPSMYIPHYGRGLPEYTFDQWLRWLDRVISTAKLYGNLQVIPCLSPQLHDARWISDIRIGRLCATYREMLSECELRGLDTITWVGWTGTAPGEWRDFSEW